MSKLLVLHTTSVNVYGYSWFSFATLGFAVIGLALLYFKLKCQTIESEKQKTKQNAKNVDITTFVKGLKQNGTHGRVCINKCC